MGKLDMMFLDIYRCISDDATARDVIMADFERWGKILKLEAHSEQDAFIEVFKKRQEFRSLVKYRLKGTSLLQEYEKSATPLPSWFYVQNLYLSTVSIGPGLYIEHGFSSIIYAKSIGRNFSFNQNVTVGSGKGGIPTIGDDCTIRTGAVVFGNVSIGNRVKIGANAVVNFDVPDDCTVVAPRATILKGKQA
jgi:serine O-acetyltransferase